MASLRITVQVEEDGAPVPGFPLVRRLEVTETARFTYQQATGGGYVAVPASQLDTIQALCLVASQAVTVRLDGQSDAGIPLLQGGLLLIVGADIDAGAGASNAKVDNSSGATATLDGWAGGE